MKKLDKDYITGTFFVILQIGIMFFNITNGRLGVFYWFCNHTPLLLAIGFFLKNKNIIKSLVNVGFIAQFIWGLDFIYTLITAKTLLNITPYVFQNQGLAIIIPPVVHLFSTNLALLITRRDKPTNRVLIYSLIYVVLLYVITILFTNPEQNINCLQRICAFEQYTPSNYTVFWIPLVFILIVLPTHGIQYLIYKISTKELKPLKTKYKDEVQSKT